MLSSSRNAESDSIVFALAKAANREIAKETIRCALAVTISLTSTSLPNPYIVDLKSFVRCGSHDDPLLIAAAG